MGEKRRLPVLASTPADDQDDGSRPPWHWAVFAAVMTFAAWLPLAAVAGAAVRAQAARLAGSGATGSASVAEVEASPAALRSLATTMVVAHGAALALATLSAGWLLGRFGRSAGPRHAAAGAAGCVLSAVALSWSTTGFTAAPLAAVALGAACGAAGASIARRDKRPRR